MPGPQVQPTLTPQRLKGNAFGDNSTPASAPRGTSLNEQVVQNQVATMHPLAEEGSYFTITNPTPGTGVAHATVASFTSTAALFSLFNSAPIGGPNVYLDFLRLIQTATAPATSLQQSFLIQLDQNLNRAPTANNVLLTPVNMNLASGNKGYSQWQAFNAGSLTVPAQATATTKNASRFNVVTGVAVAFDNVFINFGGVDKMGSRGGLTAAKATDPVFAAASAPPIMCAPQTWLTIFRWSVGEATNVASYEYELGYFER